MIDRGSDELGPTGLSSLPTKKQFSKNHTS